MLDKVTGFMDYFRKIPATFLVAMIVVVGIILFVPDSIAESLAVKGFRESYRVYLGPSFLLLVSFACARLFSFFARGQASKKNLERKQSLLYQLTPEEKGYLLPYIQQQLHSVYVGHEDGVMAGLRAKGITYLPSSTGDVLNGFAFNLQPWAREYLVNNPHLLDGYVGEPMTPSEKMGFGGW